MSTTINQADNLYNQYSQWNKDAAPAVFEAQTEEEFAKVNEQAGLFDFQQGNDYFSSLHQFALGGVRSADSNGNGLVDYNEYVEQGKKEYKGILDESTIKELEDSQALLLNFWAQDMDINNEISVEDLELFYSIADESLPSEKNLRTKDGKFSQDDLAQASETLLGMLEEKKPTLEKELSQRSEELYLAQTEHKKSELKNIMGWDSNKDNEIQQEEFMIAMQNKKGDTPEAKAGAYSVWNIMGNVIGDDFDEKNTLDIVDIGLYIENQYSSGFSSDNYYNFLLENFTNEDAPNHGYYQQVLEAYKNIA